MVEAAGQYLNDMESTAKLLDSIKDQNFYQNALKQQQEKLRDNDLLPSQQLLNRLTNKKQSYTDAILDLANEHAKYFKDDLSDDSEAQFKQLTQASHQEQLDIETADAISFDEYLERYFSS